MAGFFGGDTEQMRAQGAACVQGAQRMEEITEATTVLINAVPWLGPDAVAFKAWWNGSVRPSMLSQAADVRSKGMEIDQHSQEQDQASSDDGTGGSFWGELVENLKDWFGVGGTTGPVIGIPLGPQTIRDLGVALGASPLDPRQAIYGSEGYIGLGGPASGSWQVGNESTSYLGERSREWGPLEGFLRGGASAGHDLTVDGFGNMTYTEGAQIGGELGYGYQFGDPDGWSYGGEVAVGAEVYAERGVTVGPDGFGLGAGAGARVYADAEATLTTPGGQTVTIGGEASYGANAVAHAYAHQTRNEDGEVNGFAFGAGFDANAGGAASADFMYESPNGWFSGGAGVSADVGAGASGGGGVVVSSDQVGFTMNLGASAGVGGGLEFGFSVNPNAIVESISPGDYNFDDLLSDAGTAWDAGTSAVGDALDAINPFS